MNKLNTFFLITTLIGAIFVILPIIQDRHGVQSIVLASSGWFVVCTSSIYYVLNGEKLI